MRFSRWWLSASGISSIALYTREKLIEVMESD